MAKLPNVKKSTDNSAQPANPIKALLGLQPTAPVNPIQAMLLAKSAKPVNLIDEPEYMNLQDEYERLSARTDDEPEDQINPINSISESPRHQSGKRSSSQPK